MHAFNEVQFVVEFVLRFKIMNTKITVFRAERYNQYSKCLLYCPK